MKERTKFVLKWKERFHAAEGGRVNIAELCRMFGISRQPGYEWIGRYRAPRASMIAARRLQPRPRETAWTAL